MTIQRVVTEVKDSENSSGENSSIAAHMSLDVVRKVATTTVVFSTRLYIAIATQLCFDIIGTVSIVVAVAAFGVTWTTIKDIISTTTDLISGIKNLVDTTTQAFFIHHKVTMTTSLIPRIIETTSTAPVP
jgi:hypothetical protein